MGSKRYLFHVNMAKDIVHYNSIRQLRRIMLFFRRWGGNVVFNQHPKMFPEPYLKCFQKLEK